MGFEGLLVTDSMGMGAIDQHWGMEEASVLAVLAGADMLIFGADKGHEHGGAGWGLHVSRRGGAERDGFRNPASTGAWPASFVRRKLWAS
jgi:hypothetical protein